ASSFPGQPFQIYVHDQQSGAITLVSVNRDGTGAGTSDSIQSLISADGRFVVFTSSAGNLVSIPTPADASPANASQVFVRDLQTQTTTLVSVDRTGSSAGNRNSFSPVISVDGRFIAFLSSASNLVANDQAGGEQLFVRDMVTGVTTLASVNVDGTDGANARVLDKSDGEAPIISANGQFVVFQSQATNLVANAPAPA